MTKKILIVDDENALNEQLSKIFKSIGDVEVFQATTGEAAITMAQEIIPDLIIMDYKLPKMDGWEAARVIKHIKECEHIFVVGHTAWASIQNIKDGVAAGLAEIMTKPINIDQWRMAFRKYLQL
jgi:CheY-like chemotaxis protein